MSSQNSKIDNIDVNGMVEGISYFLIDDSEADIPTPFKECLEQDKLDYSLDSLKIVDKYLEKVRKEPKIKILSDEEFTVINNLAGCLDRLFRQVV